MATKKEIKAETEKAEKIVEEVSMEDLTDEGKAELKKKIDKKTTSIANKVKKNNGKVKAGFKTKGFFFIMRNIKFIL